MYGVWRVRVNHTTNETTEGWLANLDGTVRLYDLEQEADNEAADLNMNMNRPHYADVLTNRFESRLYTEGKIFPRRSRRASA